MEIPGMSEGLIIQERYKLIRKLGAGGMGEVWEACHALLPNNRFAIKFLYAHDQNSEQFERFTREAKILARLEHTNITKIHDYQLSHTPPYIVLEYLEGEALNERLNRSRQQHETGLPIAEVVHIIAQVRDALEMTHREGVIHRDLKPENIYLCDQGNEEGVLVKVLDFGVSKMAGEQQITLHQQGFLGTPQYMSPEQALGQENLDSRADQFSLGIIIYEMLSGKLPFKGEQIVQIATQIVHGDPAYIRELVPALPEEAAQALHQSLCKSPEDRYPSCEDFINAFIAGTQKETEFDEWSMDAPTEVGVRYSLVESSNSILFPSGASTQNLNVPFQDQGQSQVRDDEGPQTIRMPFNPQLYGINSNVETHHSQTTQPEMPDFKVEYAHAIGETNIPLRQRRPPTIQLQMPETSDPMSFPEARPAIQVPYQSPKTMADKRTGLMLGFVIFVAIIAGFISMSDQAESLSEHAQTVNESPKLKGTLIFPTFKKDILGLSLTKKLNQTRRKRFIKRKTLPRSQAKVSLGNLQLIVHVQTSQPKSTDLLRESSLHWFGPNQQHHVQAFIPFPKPLGTQGFWKAETPFRQDMLGRWVAIIVQDEQLVAELPFEVTR